MNKTPSTLVVVLSVLLPSFCYAALPELNFNNASFEELSKAAKDSDYDRVKNDAKVALNQLKRLGDSAEHMRKHLGDLDKEMGNNKYGDWYNEKLLPLLGPVKNLEKTIRQKHDEAQGQVKKDLELAKSGHFDSIRQDIKDINNFYAGKEPDLDKKRQEIDNVVQAYQRDLANALKAVATFRQLPAIVSLLAIKPQLVHDIFQRADPNNALHRRIVLVKEKGEYSDSLYENVPKAVEILDGQEKLAYPTIVCSPKNKACTGN